MREMTIGAPRGLYENLNIVIDEGQNSVIARGPADELKSLGELLEALDQPKRQVLIEATIVEGHIGRRRLPRRSMGRR